ncbi:MAG: polyphosphate kinase 2 [bacterium]|nr:polyphosphate kinase 2 [bacterium]
MTKGSFTNRIWSAIVGNKADQAAGDFSDFDLNQEVLPNWIDEQSHASGSYPYAKRMKNKEYVGELHSLHIELAKLQRHVSDQGERVVLVFEGRDAAGKGGSIKRFMEHLNPRSAKVVALAKPTDEEQGQWYFQRYIAHLPTKGNMTLFDRSWYNRAGVEPVMGFCTPEQNAQFLQEAPAFEKMLKREGIKLFKFWLTVGREMQMKRFHARRHDPLKQWKLSPIDYKSIPLWDDYTMNIGKMFEFTHAEDTPWTIVKANDKRRARLAIIRSVLSQFEYAGKDHEVVGAPDDNIVGHSRDLLSTA